MNIASKFHGDHPVAVETFNTANVNLTVALEGRSGGDQNH